MRCKTRKWFPLLCAISLPVFSANVLNTPAEQSAIADSGILLDLVSESGQQIMVGEYGRILTRHSAQESWQQGQVPVQTTLTSVEIVDADTAWAVGHQGVLLSSNDGGGSWLKRFDGVELTRLLRISLEEQLHSLSKRIEQESDEDLREELEMQLDDVSYKLEDMPADSGLEIPFFDLLFVSEQHGFVVGAYGALLETKDAGNSWQYIGHTVPNPDGFHLNAISSDGQRNLYIVGEAGLALRSVDLGASWQATEIDYDGSLFGVTANDEVVYSYGLRGNMFKSVDHGNSWRGIDTGMTNHIFSADWLTNGDLLLVGAAGLTLSYDGNRFSDHSDPEQRIDLTSVTVIGQEVVTTSLAGWQVKTEVQGGE